MGAGVQPGKLPVTENLHFPITAFYKGESQEKNFPGDWKEARFLSGSPAHVMLGGSWGSLFSQIHVVNRPSAATICFDYFLECGFGITVAMWEVGPRNRPGEESGVARIGCRCRSDRLSRSEIDLN
jgi:hypothetical protein